MPKKKSIRDSKYLLGRLQKEHPAIYADYLAKKYSSVNAAARAAGLIKTRSRLDEMKNAFSKATPSQQAAFDAWRASQASPKANRSQPAHCRVPLP